MGFLENRRRKRVAQSSAINWDNLVPVAVIGPELQRVAEAGLIGDAATNRAIEIRDAATALVRYRRS